MNVRVTQATSDENGQTVRKQILVVDRDIAAGEVIYKENPVVTALDLDLQGKGTNCSHCFRAIHDPEPRRNPDDTIGATYCSEECQLQSGVQSQNLLFSLIPALPQSHPNSDSPVNQPTDEDKEERKEAQEAFVKYLTDTQKVAPLLVARFVARVVLEEQFKLNLSTSPTPAASDLPESSDDGHDYTFYDHIERLRFLELEESEVEEKEGKMVRSVLRTAVGGLEDFLTQERYMTLKGKMAYNGFGVCFSGGRNDRPESQDRPENRERTRTPYGTARQIGTAFYRVSSYLGHSCDPSARPSYPNGTAELHLIATRPLKKGDELTVAWVDVSQHEGESQADARRRRRMELARGWRFACSCKRCVEEAIQLGVTIKSDGIAPTGAVKVEPAVEKFESGAQ